MANFEELHLKVLLWAKEKGIIDKATTLTQLGKTQEELDETVKAVKENDRDEVIDGLGDILVTIIIAARLYDLDIVECLDTAYGVISKRAGKMVDGVFVKDQK